jgi:hypothetical protein
MSIADLFRTQQAQSQAPNPQDPRIGASTNLPPQLRQLMAMKTMADQAQMRQAAQVQQTPPANQMPTVAQKVQQTAMTMAEQQRQQQMAQQAMMQQAQQAQQPMQGFAHGGLATLKRRFATGGSTLPFIRDIEDWQQSLVEPKRQKLAELERRAAVRDAQRAAEEAMLAEGSAPSVNPFQSLLDMLSGKNARGGKSIEDYYRLPKPEEAATPSAAGGNDPRNRSIDKLRGQAPVSADPRAGARAIDRQLALSQAPPQNRGAGPSAAPRGAAPSAGIAALTQPTGGTSGGAPSEWENYLREQMKIKAMSPEDAMAAEEALRAKYGPKGEKLAMLEKQMAEREAQIEKEKGKRPELLEILMGMAGASAANDAKRRGGSKGAALLGAAQTIQGAKNAREAKVELLRNAQQQMALSIAEMRDAERSGNLQAMQAAREKAIAAGQELQKAQTAIATGGFKEDRADGRTDKEIAARAAETRIREEGADRRSAAQNATSIKTAGMRSAGGGLAGLTPYQQAQVIQKAQAAAKKAAEAWVQQPQNFGATPQQKAEYEEQEFERLMQTVNAQGLPFGAVINSRNAPGASTSGTPRAGWGQAIEKP